MIVLWEGVTVEDTSLSGGLYITIGLVFVVVLIVLFALASLSKTRVLLNSSGKNRLNGMGKMLPFHTADCWISTILRESKER